MGKKRIATNKSSSSGGSRTRSATKKSSKRKLVSGILHVMATYNNTRMTLTDREGGVVLFATSGGLGFKGAKKGTPFAAGKIGDLMAERSEEIGLKDVDVVVRGVGAGRESAVRAFAAHGVVINSIKDRTPIPHNGPRPKKPRRV